jgi:hypothetical protein
MIFFNINYGVIKIQVYIEPNMSRSMSEQKIVYQKSRQNPLIFEKDFDI